MLSKFKFTKISAARLFPFFLLFFLMPRQCSLVDEKCSENILRMWWPWYGVKRGLGLTNWYNLAAGLEGLELCSTSTSTNLFNDLRAPSRALCWCWCWCCCTFKTVNVKCLSICSTYCQVYVLSTLILARILSGHNYQHSWVYVHTHTAAHKFWRISLTLSLTHSLTHSHFRWHGRGPRVPYCY